MSSNRLGRIVRVKKLVEQSRAADLAESQGSLDAARRDLSETHGKLAAVNSQQTDSAPSAQRLRLAAAYQGHLEEKADHQTSGVADREVVVEHRRDAVQAAWKERRLLENVHDRAVEREQAEVEASERKILEGMALDGYVRRRSGDER